MKTRLKFNVVLLDTNGHIAYNFYTKKLNASEVLGKVYVDYNKYKNRTIRRPCVKIKKLEVSLNTDTLYRLTLFSEDEKIVSVYDQVSSNLLKLKNMWTILDKNNTATIKSLGSITSERKLAA